VGGRLYTGYLLRWISGAVWDHASICRFGTAEESNQRYKFYWHMDKLVCPLPRFATQCGYDPTDSLARPEIGKLGSLSNLSEMETLFEGIDLGAFQSRFTHQLDIGDNLCDVLLLR